jgi:tetratricopeptide (TPR) repeat protein
MRKFVVALFVLLAGATAVGVYWNSLPNDFINMDDLDLIVRNHYIKNLRWENIKAIFTPGTVGAFQPVRTLSYAVDYHFWKLNPIGYHVTNLLCHVLNTCLIFLLIKIFRQGTTTAVLTALLFAVHPQHVEAVTWLSGRRDVLSAFFVLLSLFGYIISRNTKRPSRQIVWYGISIAACCLGLLSKASAVVLPVLLVLYDSTFGVPSESTLRTRMRHVMRSAGYYVPFAIATAGFLWIFVSTSKVSGVMRPDYHGGSGIVTFLTMLRVFAEYLYQFVVPTNLSLTYGIRIIVSPWESSFLVAALTLIGVAVLAGIAWKRAQIVSFGIVWWAVTLLPVSNILPIAAVKADRYMYVPSIGCCLVLAWLLNRGWMMLCRIESSGVEKRLVQGLYWLMIGTIIGSYGWLTIRRNRDWLNSETLWNATLETHPDSPIALNNLGLVYAEREEYERAINLYQYLLHEHPQQHGIERVYTNLGDAYRGNEQSNEALNAYQQALEYNPGYIEAYLGLGRVTAGLRDYDNAAQIYQLAQDLDPHNEHVALQLGKLRFIEGKYEAAITLFQEVIERNLYEMAAYNGLGLCYANTGEYDKAYLTYQQALERDPTSTIIRNSLGTLYMGQGEQEKAIRQFQESLRIDPENVEVRNNLGLLLLRTGQPADALRELMETVKRQPDDARIISNLARAYAAVGLPEQAIEIAQWALELDPSLFQTQVFLGDVCAALDDVGCATEAYEHALELQPQNRRVQEKLQQLR